MAEDGKDRLEPKVTALLAISVERFLRETGIAKPRPRSIDKMLSDAGLTAREIASVLGKSEQAVYAVLQAAEKKKRPSRRKKAEQGSASSGT